MRAAISLPFAVYLALAAAQLDLSDLPDGISLDDISIPSGVDVGDILPTELPSVLPTEIPDSIATLLPSGLLPSGTGSAATPTTSSSSSGDSNSLPGLVDQLPRCAIGCLESTASDIGCSATDFTCLCSRSEDLVNKMKDCILSGNSGRCSLSDISSAASVAPKICERVNSNPSTEEVASASQIVAGAIETGAATTSGGTSNDDGSGAARIGAGVSIFGSLLAVVMAF